MYSYDFPAPYPEIVLYTVLCIICLCIGGTILKKHCKHKICPHLIPLVIVILSFVISNLYTGGLQALFTLNIHDVRAITNGLSAIGLHQLISKTYDHFRYKKMYKKKCDSKKIAAED